MSVLRCERQPGGMTGTGRRSTQISGAGSDLLVCGHEPSTGKGPTCSCHGYSSSSPLRMACSFLCEVQLRETHKMSLFFPKFMSLCTKQRKLMQAPDRTATSWPGLSKAHFSTKTSPFKGSSHKKKSVIHVMLNNLHSLQK